MHIASSMYAACMQRLGLGGAQNLFAPLGTRRRSVRSSAETQCKGFIYIQSRAELRGSIAPDWTRSLLGSARLGSARPQPCRVRASHAELHCHTIARPRQVDKIHFSPGVGCLRISVLVQLSGVTYQSNTANGSGDVIMALFFVRVTSG